MASLTPDHGVHWDQQGIDGEDRLALFGYGLFETILVTRQGTRFLPRHYERMKTGANLLGLEMPSLAGWSCMIEEYLDYARLPQTPFALRVTLSGGAPAQTLASHSLLRLRSIHYTTGQYQNGLALTLLSSFRNESSALCRIKSTNYLENVLAKEDAAKRGFDEGLWINTRGELAEGTVSNLFFVREGKLFTPALACGCLPGTRRALILELAETLDLPWEEGSYPLTVLGQAAEIFLTNSLMGVMPVSRVDQQRFNVAPVGDSQSITRRLAKALQKLVQE